MSQAFQRYSRIDSADTGQLHGILATNGEASDGHIVDIKGMRLPDSAPLLFGHDDFTGRSNLGSWDTFKKELGDGSLGTQLLRGDATIELEGVGSQADFRADMAMMIENGHINQFSMRWDALEAPVRRVNLPSDHPAYVDSKKSDVDDPRRWGLFFGKSRLLEGSVVTLGADPEAIIGRMKDTTGELRAMWSRSVFEMFRHDEAPAELEEIIGSIRQDVEHLRTLGFGDFGGILRCVMRDETDPATLVEVAEDGRRVLIPKWAYERLTQDSLRCLRTAFGVLADATAERPVAPQQRSEEPQEVPADPSPESAEPEATGEESVGQRQSLDPSMIAEGIAKSNEDREKRMNEWAADAVRRLIRGEISQ